MALTICDQTQTLRRLPHLSGSSWCNYSTNRTCAQHPSDSERWRGVTLHAVEKEIGPMAKLAANLRLHGADATYVALAGLINSIAYVGPCTGEEAVSL